MFLDLLCSLFAVVIGKLAYLLAKAIAVSWGLAGATAAAA